MAKRKKEQRPDYIGEPGISYFFHLDGNVPSKKNRLRFSGAGKMFQDSKFTKWHKLAVLQMEPQRLSGWFSHTKEVVISFTFETLRVKDLSNCAESVMDLLVDVGILKDDNFKVVPQLLLKGSYTKGVSKTNVEIKI